MIIALRRTAAPPDKQPLALHSALPLSILPFPPPFRTQTPYRYFCRSWLPFRLFQLHSGLPDFISALKHSVFRSSHSQGKSSRSQVAVAFSHQALFALKSLVGGVL